MLHDLLISDQRVPKNDVCRSEIQPGVDQNDSLLILTKVEKDERSVNNRPGHIVQDSAV
jgi:hypothetical protein